MPAATIALLVAQYGLPFVQQIVAWVETPNKTVTSADLQILAGLASKSSADYLAAAGGPPVAPAVA